MGRRWTEARSETLTAELLQEEPVSWRLFCTFIYRYVKTLSNIFLEYRYNQKVVTAMPERELNYNGEARKIL
jgi:hypothetical protein